MKFAGASQTHTTRASKLAGSGNVSAVMAEALAEEEEYRQGPRSPCSCSLQLQGSPARRAESRQGWPLPEFQAGSVKAKGSSPGEFAPPFLESVA